MIVFRTQWMSTVWCKGEYKGEYNFTTAGTPSVVGRRLCLLLISFLRQEAAPRGRIENVQSNRIETDPD